MNRKLFLRNTLPLGIGLSGIGFQTKKSIDHSVQQNQSIKIPPYLKPGDRIGITCPGGYISGADLVPVVETLEGWGFTVQLGKTVDSREHHFSASDLGRTADLQMMLDDSSIRAILFGRGGYGAARIIDRLDFSKFQQEPKWIAGFSDATVFHQYLHQIVKVASIHCKMGNSFPAKGQPIETLQLESLDTIRKTFSGIKYRYDVLPSMYNRSGIAEGQLIGGNMKVLESMICTPGDLDTKNKILFLEDTGEYLYSIDRMFGHFKRSGKLSGLKALIIGGFKVKPDEDGEDFGKTIEEIVLDHVSSYGYPVSFGFPVGHQKHHVALKCGLQHRLEVGSEKVLLTDF